MMQDQSCVSQKRERLFPLEEFKLLFFVVDPVAVCSCFFLFVVFFSLCCSQDLHKENLPEYLIK